MTKDRYSKTSLGIHLKQLRQEAGLKLVEISGECGIQPSYLSMIESGDRVPSLDLLYRLAKALGVSPISILTLADSLPKGIVSDLLEKERLKLELATFRIRKSTSIFMKDNNEMSAETILDYLENHDRDHLQILYNNAAEKFPELKDLPEKEAILKAQMEEVSPGEALFRNEAPAPRMPYLETPEMLLELKKTLRWSWEGLGAEFGVSGRTVFRGAHRKCRISKKIKKKIEYLYWTVLRRLKEDVKPLYFGYLKGSGAPLELFLSELEQAGLGSEIKRRFIELEPDLKPLKDKILAEFFLERARAKTNPSVSKIMELNAGKPAKLLERTNRYKSTMDGGASSVSVKTRNNGYEKNARLMKKPRKQMSVNKSSSRESKQGGGNKVPPSGDDDGGGGDDADSWLLKRSNKNRTIYLLAEQIFDNLRWEIPGFGLGNGLPKREEEMKLIRPEGRKYWIIEFYVGKERHRCSTRCVGKQDAELVKKVLWNKVMAAGGKFPGEETHTLKDVFDKYISEHSLGIKVSYERDLLSAKNLLRDLKNPKLANLGPKVVDDWQQRRRKATMKNGKTLSPRTVNLERTFLRTTLKIAKNRWGWIKENPVDAVPPLAYKGQREIWFMEGERKRILSACEELGAPWFGDFLECKWLTGFRRGEILAVKRGQVFLDEETPFIRLTREKSRITMDYPLVLDKVTEVLRRLCANRNADESVFRDRNGLPLTVPEVRYWWLKVKEKAGILKGRVHDCRHTFATLCYEAELDDVTIMYLLGQKTLQVTHGYMHPPLKTVAERLKKLDEK